MNSTSYSQRVEIIDKKLNISQNRQAELAHISTSSLYYKSTLSELDNKIMNEIDLIYTEHIYYGARRISKELKRRGYAVGREKTRTYMEKMYICAMYPKKNTSIPNKDHQVYPYLLRGVKITRPNQVWSTDITYIKLPGGFVYLLAIIDRYSRKVIAWDVSSSMDKEFCCGVLKKALLLGKPEIFNSDQGSQFTSKDFTDLLETAEVKISMDGVGRCFDNIRIERLWRTVKYEDVHLNEYHTPIDTYHGLTIYFNKYNNSRLHSSLGYRTPSEAYQDKH